MAGNTGMKKTYRPSAKLEVFYTGGPIKLNSDGTLLACACGDETKIVNVATGEVSMTCPGDEEPITALCFTPSADFLFTVSKSQTLKKWDINTGDCVRSWKVHKAPVADMTVDPTGGVLATCSADRTVSVWDVEGGYCTHNFKGHSGVVLNVVFHPKKAILFSAGDGSEVRMWNLKSQQMTILKGHMSAVTCLSISEDEKYLISGGRDKVVILWDIENENKIEKLATVPVYEIVEGVAFAPQYLLEKLDIKKTERKSRAPCLLFVTCGERGLVKVWRTDNGKVIGEQEKLPGKHDGGEMTYLSLLPNTLGAVTSSADCSVAFWEFKVAEQALEVAQSHLMVGNNDEITDLEWIGQKHSPTHIALATNSTHIRLFDAASLNCCSTLAGHSGAVLCTASKCLTGGTTVILSGSKDNSIRIWEALSGRCLAQGTGHTAAVTSVAISKKELKFAVTVGSDMLLKVWDIKDILEKTGEENEPAKIRVISGVVAHKKEINTVDIAPTDSMLCTGSQDKTAKIFRLPDLVLVQTLTGHKRGIWCVKFSPVSKTVATASGDQTIKLWSISDGSCTRTLEGHLGAVLKISFVTSGTQLLSCGGDALVKLWNVDSNECVNTFDEHEDRIWAMECSGECEEKMVTGGSDSVLTIWQDSTLLDEKEGAKKEHEEILKEQKLANALKMEDYRMASSLAFQLEQPRRLLSILKTTCPNSKHQKILSNLVGDLGYNEVKKCLEYIRDWNTNARNCHEAQFLLRALLQSIPPETLLSIPGVSHILDGIQAYTSRHFNRIDKLIQSTYLVDYTLASMNVLLPENAHSNEGKNRSLDAVLEYPETPGQTGDLTGSFINGKNDSLMDLDCLDSLEEVNTEEDSAVPDMASIPESNVEHLELGGAVMDDYVTPKKKHSKKKARSVDVTATKSSKSAKRQKTKKNKELRSV